MYSLEEYWLYGPFRETEEFWDKEIEADVKDECSKFGLVNHVAVDKLNVDVSLS